MLHWLIIGGGVHGTYLSHFLTARRGTRRDRIRVLDPHEAPLAAWRARARNTGMRFLRSPAWQNLDLDSDALDRFARGPEGQSHAEFTDRHRPGLALFHAHVDWILRRHDLTALRLIGRANRLLPCAGGIRVETDRGALEARRVLLAIGPSEPLCPPWAEALREAGAPIHHVFDADFDREALPNWSHAVVIGGGITAVQVALALARRAPGTITLLHRHPVRPYPFDTDPCWLGHCVEALGREVAYGRRRALVEEGRYRGSVPPEIVRELSYEAACGRVRIQTAAVVGATSSRDGGIALILGRNAGVVPADRVVTATGFQPDRPGGGMAHAHRRRTRSRLRPLRLSDRGLHAALASRDLRHGSAGGAGDRPRRSQPHRRPACCRANRSRCQRRVNRQASLTCLLAGSPAIRSRSPAELRRPESLSDPTLKEDL